MTTDRGPGASSSFVLVALGAIVFVSLIILGDAIVSVLTSTDVIETPGSSPLVPVVAIGAATLAWVLLCTRAVAKRGSIGSAALVALIATAAYLVAFLIAMLTTGLAAMAAMGHLVQFGYALVVFIAAIISAAGVLALTRTSGKTPEWPWEHEDGDQ